MANAFGAYLVVESWKKSLAGFGARQSWERPFEILGNLALVILAPQSPGYHAACTQPCCKATFDFPMGPPWAISAPRHTIHVVWTNYPPQLGSLGNFPKQ